MCRTGGSPAPGLGSALCIVHLAGGLPDKLANEFRYKLGVTNELATQGVTQTLN